MRFRFLVCLFVASLLSISVAVRADEGMWPIDELDKLNFKQLEKVGLELSKKQKFSKRVKEYVKLIIPLIMSSLDRIDNISDAMDLRGFAKHKKRTWYNTRKLSRNDKWAIIFTLAVFAGSLMITIFVNQGRFWNPFI